MDAKLYSYSTPASDFQSFVYWGSGGSGYKNVIYLDCEFARPRIDNFQDVNEDELKNRIVIYQRQRIETSFYMLLRSHLIDFFSTLGLTDTVELEILETGETFQLQNLRIADEGEEQDIIAPVKLTFDLVAVTAAGCQQTNYTVVAC